jgi:N-acetylglucosaminyldiphosphoundecaprenol N-acetyl-beta-D-mannosaminyltransferase
VVNSAGRGGQDDLGSLREPREVLANGGATLRPSQRVLLMGIAIDSIGEQEVVDWVIACCHRSQGGHLITMNVQVLRLALEHQEIRAIVTNADLVVADGMPIVWASRLRGRCLPERVTGSSLIWTLSEAAAHAGISVFLLGGLPGVAETAATRLTARHPGLRIAGIHCPPFGFENDDRAMAAIRDHVRKAAPGIVFCGLGFPKQERLITTLSSDWPATWFVGCGASIAFAAGSLRRAPRWMQHCSLEWIFRLSQEPRRLFARYFVRDLPFATRMLVASGAEAVRR